VTVTIHRDDWGVPYIGAPDGRAAFVGLGYAMAGDHLERICRAYLSVRGELASVFGATAIDRDVFHHRWHTLQEARSAFERMPSECQEPYVAFIEGITRYAAEHPDELPPWAPPFEPALPIALTRAALWGWMIGDAVTALALAGVALNTGGDEVDVASQGRASNAWAVGPTRTATGETYLLSDPHLPFDPPEGDPGGKAVGLALDASLLRSYECVVDAGDLSFTAFVGLGGVTPVLAQTRRCAWGMTTGGPRVSDAYRLTLDPDDSTQYVVDGERRPIHRDEVQIAVAGGSAVNRALEHVMHNGVMSPVVARDADCVHVICTPYQHVSELLELQAHEMLRAHDVGELRRAFEPCGWFPQNVVAADADGGLLYLRAGRVPVRAPGADAGGLLDGSTDATVWRGLYDLDALVQLTNPPEGFVQCCNTAPDVITPSASEAIAAEAYPADVFNDVPGRQTTRGLRTLELLGAASAMDDDQAVAIALDERWPDVDAWQAALRSALPAPPAAATAADHTWRAAADRLLGFDGKAAAESADALLWFTWREAIFIAGATEPGRLRRLTEQVLAGETIEDATLLVDAVRDMTTALVARHGHLDATLGEVHRGGVDGRTVPLGGTLLLAWPPADLSESLALIAPLRVNLFPPVAIGSTQTTVVYGGPSLRLSVLGDRPRAYTALVPGQSSRPGSPHRDDQWALLSERQLKPVVLDRRDPPLHVPLTLDVILD
jgi:acyl-homoserine lactone acylase PvdQ